jgi:hypothetical protein
VPDEALVPALNIFLSATHSGGTLSGAGGSPGWISCNNLATSRKSVLPSGYVCDQSLVALHATSTTSTHDQESTDLPVGLQQ